MLARISCSQASPLIWEIFLFYYLHAAQWKLSLSNAKTLHPPEHQPHGMSSSPALSSSKIPLQDIILSGSKHGNKIKEIQSSR